MKENEAIKEIETSLELAEMCEPNREREKEIKGYKMAIKALEEIQQYKAIGTVEEFKGLKEKNVAKKPTEIIKNEIGFYHCPHCKNTIGTSIMTYQSKHCSYCGQLLDWND